MLALIFTRKLRPMIIGSSSGWLMLAGMMARPRATSSRTNSGGEPFARGDELHLGRDLAAARVRELRHRPPVARPATRAGAGRERRRHLALPRRRAAGTAVPRSCRRGPRSTATERAAGPRGRPRPAGRSCRRRGQAGCHPTARSRAWARARPADRPRAPCGSQGTPLRRSAATMRRARATGTRLNLLWPGSESRPYRCRAPPPPARTGRARRHSPSEATGDDAPWRSALPSPVSTGAGSKGVISIPARDTPGGRISIIDGVGSRESGVGSRESGLGVEVGPASQPAVRRSAATARSAFGVDDNALCRPCLPSPSMRTSRPCASICACIGRRCWSPRRERARPRACHRPSPWTVGRCSSSSLAGPPRAPWRGGSPTNRAGRSAARSAGTCGSNRASDARRACCLPPKASSPRDSSRIRFLSDITTVVLDEFHERSVHADLGLALARQAWLARDDLRLLVMSATIDPTPGRALPGRMPGDRGAGRSAPADDRVRARRAAARGGRARAARARGQRALLSPRRARDRPGRTRGRAGRPSAWRAGA